MEFLLIAIQGTFLVSMTLHMLIFPILAIHFLSGLSESLNSINVDMISYRIPAKHISIP